MIQMNHCPSDVRYLSHLGLIHHQEALSHIGGVGGVGLVHMFIVFYALCAVKVGMKAAFKMMLRWMSRLIDWFVKRAFARLFCCVTAEQIKREHPE